MLTSGVLIGFLDWMIDTNQFPCVMDVLPILCSTRDTAGPDRIRTVVDRLSNGSLKSYRIVNDLDGVGDLLEEYYPGDFSLIERVSHFSNSLRAQFSGMHFDDAR